MSRFPTERRAEALGGVAQALTTYEGGGAERAVVPTGRLGWLLTRPDGHEWVMHANTSDWELQCHTADWVERQP
jgi:hypothetical protein